jgi:hypothetical protein
VFRSVHRRAVPALLSAALTLAAIASGRTLFWCPAMSMAASRCCCPAAQEPVGEARFTRTSCCRARVLQALPRAARPELPRPQVDPPVLSARADAPGRIAPPPARRPPTLLAQVARAGPPRDLCTVHCVLLI